MNRSLTPLIVSFAVIILLTIIMLHTRPNRPLTDEMPVLDMAPALRLSHFPARRHGVVSAPATDVRQVSGNPDTDDLLDVSRRLLAEGRETEAEDQLRTLLVFSPDHLPALSLLGGILFYSHRYAEAEAIYRRQLRMDPANAGMHNNLASVLARQERFIEAITSAEKALEINPAAAPAHVNLAGIHAATGDRERALAHFRQAHEMLGWKILPVAEDPAFRELRNDPVFVMIMAQARQDWEAVRPAGGPEAP